MNVKFVESIVVAYSRSDYKSVRNLLEIEIKSAQKLGHIVVAKRLSKLLKVIPAYGLSTQSSGKVVSEITLRQDDLLFEKVYSKVYIEDVILNGQTRKVIGNFLKEWESYDTLFSQGITPVNKIILYGKPGTGKTKLAYGIANKLNLPLVIVRLDELISSFLGKTGKNIREIFDLARTERSIIFLDEIDTIAKHRDDSKELGELKRVVTVLLQNIDNFPDSSILIGATNHENLLDSAIWRRFGLRLHIEIPSLEDRSLMFETFLRSIDSEKLVDYDLLATVTDGMSGSFINDIALSIRRSAIIENIASVDTAFALRHVISFSGAFHGLEKFNKKNLYSISNQLRKSGYSLKQISEISGLPYTTLRDNVK